MIIRLYLGDGDNDKRRRMAKKIIDIILFPFYLLFLFVSFPFTVAKIILTDKREKKIRNRYNGLKKNKKENLSEVGQFIFPNYKTEFEDFFNLFLNDKKTFAIKYEEMLEGHDNFELNELKPIEAIYIFGKSKQVLNLTDWHGEENEKEVEEFIANKLKMEIDWKYVNELRKNVELEKQRDGKFIISLFRAIDKDLESLHKKLLFFNLHWDAYVYTIVNPSSYKMMTDKFGKYFHGAKELRK